jgi:hypothetical protein
LFFENSLRRSQNKEISFPFSVGSSPHPSTEGLVVRKFLWFWGRAERGGEARKTPMRTHKYKATTRSARCSYGLFSKWVRAKVMISSQTRTSFADNERGEAAREETEAKIPRREATNWDGTGAAKRADLSLFCI